uniref:Parathymosin n=1 Tax=Solanum tuberosum TaxID=4113 RepID=M1BMU4_SOLTU
MDCRKMAISGGPQPPPINLKSPSSPLSTTVVNNPTFFPIFTSERKPKNKFQEEDLEEDLEEDPEEDPEEDLEEDPEEDPEEYPEEDLKENPEE